MAQKSHAELPTLPNDDDVGEGDQVISLPDAVAASGSPEQLVETARSFAEQTTAENTNKAYKADWAHFASWCRRRGASQLTPDPQLISLYITECAEPQTKGAPALSYRTIAWLLGFNKNTVQRIFQIKGWHVRKRSIGARPRVQARPSVAQKPNERWSTDLCRVWAGKDGWATLALVMDCHTRELLGWHLSRSGKATTAVSALEHALIARFGTLGKVDEPFLLRSDSGLVFTSRAYTKLVRSYLPRDTQVAALSNRNMKAICDRLNGTPRKCLGRRTPTEAFREEMMKLR